MGLKRHVKRSTGGTEPKLLDGYRLSESLPYMLARAGTQMTEKFSEELADFDMTLPMYRVLAALWEHDDQKLTELAAVIDADTSTLSRLVAAMRKRDLVASERRKHDARSICISLTPRGKERLKILIPRARHHETTAIGEINPSEIEKIKGTLRRIHINLIENR